MNLRVIVIKKVTNWRTRRIDAAGPTVKRKPFKRHSFSGCQIAIIWHTLPTKSNIVLVMVDSYLSGPPRVAHIILQSLLLFAGYFFFRVDSTCFLAAIFLFTIETCHKLYHTLLSWFYSHALLMSSKIATFCLPE